MAWRSAFRGRRALLATLSLFLAACATTGKYEASLDALVGRPASDLASVYGPPTETFHSGDHTFLVYASTRLVQFAPLPNYTGSYPNYTKSRSCMTIFDTRGGVVVDWAIKGNDCAQELANRTPATP